MRPNSPCSPSGSALGPGVRVDAGGAAAPPPRRPLIRARRAGAAALLLAWASPLCAAPLWAGLAWASAAPPQPGMVTTAAPAAPSPAPAHKGAVPAPSNAAAPPPSNAGGSNRGPARARVGFLLLSVGDVSVAASSYTLDMYLSFACDRPCDPEHFEFVNGRPLLEDAQTKTSTQRTYRVLAQLRGAWDLRAYPFDRDDLTVGIEDRILDADKLVYVVDRAHTAIDSTAVVAGWVFPRRWSATVTDHAYPVFNETYSRYVFTTALQRPVLVGVLTLAPAVILVAVGLLALGLRADLGTQRLTVSTSALVAMVLFHISLRAGLPPVGYFTFADRFVIISYVVLAMIIVLAMVILNRLHAGDAAGAERVRRTACWAVPAVWVGLEAIVVAVMLVGRGG